MYQSWWTFSICSIICNVKKLSVVTWWGTHIQLHLRMSHRKKLLVFVNDLMFTAWKKAVAPRNGATLARSWEAGHIHYLLISELTFGVWPRSMRRGRIYKGTLPLLLAFSSKGSRVLITQKAPLPIWTERRGPVSYSWPGTGQNKHHDKHRQRPNRRLIPNASTDD